MPHLPVRAVVALLILAASVTALVWPTPTPALPPCPTEDSVSCVWDAQQQGNGHGRSFTTDEHGTPTYTD